MAISVPSEPKKHTTVYDNFRGVDLSNDLTNVWRRRSPDGLNMLPDIDGRPYKRKGWCIELTPADFRSAAGVASTVKVITDRMYYFELGGCDYLMIFNNLGIFTYSENPLANSPYRRLLVHHTTYINLSNQSQSLPANIDPRKAFFFEGAGTAGFYVFAGTKLFRYDGAYFRETSPHVPVVLIGCDPHGAGTTLEAVNMLTPKRIVQYTCEHTETTSYDEEGNPTTTRTGPTTFVVPGGFDSAPIVETRNTTTGAWETATGYTAANGVITFTTAPEDVIVGEDNLRVTYIPSGMGDSYVTSTVNRGEQTISITQTQEQERYGYGGSFSEWTTKWTTKQGSGVKFDVSGIKTDATTFGRDYTLSARNSSNNGWTTLSENDVNCSFLGYENSLSVIPKMVLFSSESYHCDTVVNTGQVRAARAQTGEIVQRRTVTTTKTFRVKLSYTAYQYKAGSSVSEPVTAFTQCARVLVFGSGIINQVFLSASPHLNYNTRIWYSAATDPTYWPDTNYIEVGSSDTPVMGMMKVGEYLGVIKKGTSFDTSIYLAYPTSFDNDTTYAVKQNINGIGAISAGAFNTLNEEPLFLSKSGIMGIEVSQEDTDRQLRNRSFYVNKRMCNEPNLGSAISFVYDGLYILCVNDNCYVLDGSQKNSWQNSKTNLQYEAYYLENVPAQCFARFQGGLWFTDRLGNLCRFMEDTDEHPYRDAYSTGDSDWITVALPANGKVLLSNISGATATNKPEVGDTVKMNLANTWFTVTSVDDTYVYLTSGVPIEAVWSTISDDDGAVQFFKNLQKKGCVVSLLPSSDSGVKVYLKQDDQEPIFVGETDAKDYIMPTDFYVKKKIKKYKRLQIICKNDTLDDSFGIDQIVKTYTIGNYSKDKG